MGSSSETEVTKALGTPRGPLPGTSGGCLSAERRNMLYPNEHSIRASVRHPALDIDVLCDTTYG